MLSQTLSILAPLAVHVGTVLLAGGVVSALALRSGHRVVGTLPADE